MVHHDHSHYTSVSFLQKQLSWPPLSIRRLQSRLVLFYKICHQKTHLKHKRKQLGLQMQTTQHIKIHILIQLPPPNNHRLEFTATQSVCDSNGAGLQGRPNPPSPPQPVIHM